MLTSGDSGRASGAGGLNETRRAEPPVHLLAECLVRAISFDRIVF